MEVEDFDLAVDYISGNGTVFSLEQKVALQNSLTIMKKNYKFSIIKLWGKINGIRHDYFIAYGATESEFIKRIFLYSQNCTDWHVLPQATDLSMHRSLFVRQRLVGEPAYSHPCDEFLEIQVDDNQIEHEYGHFDIERYNSDFAKGKPDLAYNEILEEDLLATIVCRIDRETSIAPKGAYIKSTSGKVQVNRAFRGLSSNESVRINSYVHFHPAHIRKTAFYKNKGDCDPSFDFTDTIDNDLKQVSWSLRLERGSFVCLRHLQWLGMTFYHVPNTTSYGRLYVGDGQKNIDAPFML